jgi:predicted phage terminase large subunit-like protein
MDKKWEKYFRDYDLHCQKIQKATTINIHEAPADKISRIKKLQTDYISWFEYYFPHIAKTKSAKYHKKLSDKIINRPKGKTLAEIYRSGAKSVHVSMGIPLFLYVTDQLKFMLLMGETDTKAKILIGDIQSELQYNQRFINDYGRKFKFGDWSSGNFTTTDGVRFVSLGFGQSPRGLREGGERPDYIVIDDVDSKKHIHNDRIMRESVDYIMEDVMGCFDSSDTSRERFVFANNNFHKNSITNRLKEEFKNNIKQDKEAGEESQYAVFTVCAVKDLTTFEPTWPEKTTADYWRKKYLKRRRSFLREYMHIHVEEGKIFKPEWFQYKKILPLAKYDALMLYGDMSYKDQGDFKGLILMGKVQREYHFIHVFLRQTSRKLAAEWLYNLYTDRRLSQYNITYKIEGLFAQDEFINDFDLEGDERGFHIPIIADKRGKANKEDRIESTEGYFERMWVFFNEAEKDNSDQIELRDQYLSFEKGSGAHDDGPDCAHGCFDDLNRSTHAAAFPVRTTPRQTAADHRY